MVSGNNGDVFVVFNLFTKVDFLVVIGSKALSIFEDQFTAVRCCEVCKVGKKIRGKALFRPVASGTRKQRFSAQYVLEDTTHSMNEESWLETFSEVSTFNSVFLYGFFGNLHSNFHKNSVSIAVKKSQPSQFLGILHRTDHTGGIACLGLAECEL